MDLYSTFLVFKALYSTVLHSPSHTHIHTVHLLPMRHNSGFSILLKDTSACRFFLEDWGLNCRPSGWRTTTLPRQPHIGSYCRGAEMPHVAPEPWFADPCSNPTNRNVRRYHFITAIHVPQRIHPLCTTYPLGHVGELQTIPADIWREEGYTTDRLPAYRRANIQCRHSKSHLQLIKRLQLT